MKHLLKLTGSLFLDQFVGIISGSMLVLCVSTFFKNSFLGYFLAFCICFSFFAYVSYHSAFKSGFHDSHRAIKDTEYRGFLYKGLLAGLISSIPVMTLYIVCLITDWGILKIYYMISNMYWTWPMINMFPNHMKTVMALVIVPMTVIPWLGYIAGYKNFLLYDYFLKIYKKLIANKN